MPVAAGPVEAAHQHPGRRRGPRPAPRRHAPTPAGRPPSTASRSPATTVDGWAQGFELPAAGGRLDVTYDDPAQPHRLAVGPGRARRRPGGLALPGPPPGRRRRPARGGAAVARPRPAGEGRRARRLRAPAEAEAAAAAAPGRRRRPPADGTDETRPPPGPDGRRTAESYPDQQAAYAAGRHRTRRVPQQQASTAQYRAPRPGGARADHGAVPGGPYQSGSRTRRYGPYGSTQQQYAAQYGPTRAASTTPYGQRSVRRATTQYDQQGSTPAAAPVRRTRRRPAARHGADSRAAPTGASSEPHHPVPDRAARPPSPPSPASPRSPRPDAAGDGSREGGRPAARGAHQPALPGAQHLRPRGDRRTPPSPRHQGHRRQRQGRTRRGEQARRTLDATARPARRSTRSGKRARRRPTSRSSPLKEPGKPVTADRRRRRRPRPHRHRRRARSPPAGPCSRPPRSPRAPAAACSAPAAPPRTPSSGSPAPAPPTTAQDYVHLTNPDDAAAVVDIELYGKDGALKSDAAARASRSRRASSVPVLLSTLTDEQPTDVTVHVTARSGRVGAAVQAARRQDRRRLAGRLRRPGGQRWSCPASRRTPPPCGWSPSRPATSDADLKVRLAAPDRRDHPGRATRRCTSSAGMTAAVDLGDVTRGEAGLPAADPAPTTPAAPVVAALRVVRGKGAKQEIGFIPATAPGRARAPRSPTTAPRAPRSP